MRILVLSQYWHPENGVPQRRWTWLTEILQQAGHEVRVIAPPPHYKRKVSFRTWVEDRGFSAAFRKESGPNGETIYRSGYFPSGKSLGRRILNQGWTAVAMTFGLIKNREISRFSPDLVIGTVPALPTSVVTFLAARKLKVPYILDLRDPWPALFRESKEWDTGTGARSSRKSPLRQVPLLALIALTERSLKFVMWRCSGVLTTSSSLELQLKNELDKPTATVRNVFPSVDAERVQAKASERDLQLHVLYAGTLGRAQKLENALVAAQLARDEGVQVILRFIGEGATWEPLREAAKELSVDLDLQHQHAPEDLHESYRWADTALVHLTNWNSLEVAVPSKTYELMANQIHISGVVTGETAHLIEMLNAGDVVPPENPRALADLWVALARDPKRLNVSEDGKTWVEHEREEVAPAALLGLVERVENSR